MFAVLSIKVGRGSQGKVEVRKTKNRPPLKRLNTAKGLHLAWIGLESDTLGAASLRRAFWNQNSFPLAPVSGSALLPRMIQRYNDTTIRRCQIRVRLAHAATPGPRRSRGRPMAMGSCFPIQFHSAVGLLQTL